MKVRKSEELFAENLRAVHKTKVCLEQKIKQECTAKPSFPFVASILTMKTPEDFSDSICVSDNEEEVATILSR